MLPCAVLYDDKLYRGVFVEFINCVVLCCREEKASGRYQRGSHRFISYIHIFMRLIELEKQTIHDVLAFTNLSATEIDLVFAAVVEAPIELFLKY